ncbi:MAG: hypothetical protein VW338_00215 [Rhodospirillaceae bacterium]
MDASKFETICRKNGFNPLTPINTRHGRVLVAERYFNHHPEFEWPHWQTLWTFDRNGLDVAQKLYFKFGAASQARRRDAAAKAAAAWVKDNQTVGRYKN